VHEVRFWQILLQKHYIEREQATLIQRRVRHDSISFKFQFHSICPVTFATILDIKADIRQITVVILRFLIRHGAR
jgi:hypothetical protein